jgi:hypothetical protein
MPGSPPVWYSPLFENESGGGLLLALPYESLGDWRGGEDYEELIDEIEQFLCHPLGSGTGVFLTDDEGIHEAHWMRLEGRPGVLLVVWVAWDDPARPTFPPDWKQVARAWQQGEDPRQRWIEARLSQGDPDWERHEATVTLRDGVLLLMHGEESAGKARLARPRAIARCGQAVPVGLAPGNYHVETAVIDDLPQEAHYCLLCRWVPAA